MAAIIQLNLEFVQQIEKAFQHAREHGQAEITIRIPLENTQTTLDKLRTRGTPLDLIGSYLLVSQVNDAKQALRSAILEYIVERLMCQPEVNSVQFSTNNSLTTLMNQLNIKPFVLSTPVETFTLTDALNATISNIIYQQAELIIEQMLPKLIKQTQKHDIHIIPEHSIINLEASYKNTIPNKLTLQTTIDFMIITPN